MKKSPPKNIDFTRSNSSLARQHNASIYIVARWRRETGLSSSTHRGGTPYHADQSLRPCPLSIDFSKSDKALAEIHRAAHITVARWRREAGVAKTHKNSGAMWQALDWSESSVTLAQEMGVSITTVLRRRRKNQP